MTLSDLQGYSYIGNLFKWELSNSCVGRQEVNWQRASRGLSAI